MSSLRVSNLRGETDGSSPTFPDGVVVSGVVTSTSFSGNLTGNVTGNIVGNVTGDVTGNVNVTGDASFTGDVSIGGTLTYQDVTNVDSVGVITARGGIKIGAGQSVSAVSGIITYYGDGSQLDGIESGFSNFVASGTIPNSATVIIKDDGKVGIITQTGTSTPNVGTAVEFDSDNSPYIQAVYDSANNKVVIAYSDYGNSQYGTAIVGTVSGSSISFGTPVVFESADSDHLGMTYDSTNEKVVILYEDKGNTNKGTGIVGTVSGTSISFGTPAVFESGNAQTYIQAAYDSSNGKVVVVYRDDSNSYYGTAVVGTVTGTSISFGTPVVFESATTQYTVVTYVGNGKVVIAYEDVGNSQYGTAIVGTVSGTSISFGAPVVFESAGVNHIGITYDSGNDKVVIVYSDDGNSFYGTAVVGAVSGNSISFGTPVAFKSARITYPSLAYDASNQKVVAAYVDGGNSSFLEAAVGTVSGTSISFDSPFLVVSGNTSWLGAAYDSSNGKVVIGYRDDLTTTGKAIVYSTTSLVTNLTTENYIGIAAEAISDGQTGKVNIIGGVNSGQTGLTTARTYYVQGDGTLDTSAGNPSVVAGTSISGTQIIVKG